MRPFAYHDRLVTAALATAGLLAAGCRSPVSAPLTTPPEPPTPAADATAFSTPTYTAAEAHFDANRNPYSGLPSTRADIAARRPSAASIRLAAPATGAPPDLAGLQASELVFLVATNPAHLVAMTLDAPDERPAVGPLGPAWPVDIAVARQFGALLRAATASSGAATAQATAPVPLELLQAGSTPDVVLPVVTPPAGEPARPSWGFAEERDAAARQIMQRVTVTIPVDLIGRSEPGTPATTATTALTRTAALAWRYDPALTVYRWELDGQPVVDQATGEGITVANLVFVMYPGLGNADAPEAFNRLNDMAVLIRNGHAQPLDWRLADTGGPFQLLDGFGKPASLRPGNTWVILSDRLRQVAWWPHAEFEPTPAPSPGPAPTATPEPAR